MSASELSAPVIAAKYRFVDVYVTNEYLQPFAEVGRDHVHQAQLRERGVLVQAETLAVEKYEVHLCRDQQQPGTGCNRPERAGSYFRPNLQSRKYQRAGAKSHCAEPETKAAVLLRLGNKDFLVPCCGVQSRLGN